MTNWLPTRITAAPEDGYLLAIKPSRRAVKIIRTDATVLEKLCVEYEHDAQALLAVLQPTLANSTGVGVANGDRTMRRKRAPR